jgi:endonuclease/exonuclease/phosphatase family metal-dependent hydrolase
MAKSFIRRATKTVIVFINLLVAFIFLLACLTPYLSTSTWWILGFTGLTVPYAIIILFFFIIFWLIVKPKLSLISILVLCMGWQQIEVMAAFKPGPMLSERKRENHIRIIDWNVQSFNGLSKKPLVKKQIRKDIAASILLLEPDVICLQEFNTAADGGAQTNNIALFKKRYKYFYFSKDYSRHQGDYQSGCIIFSKYQIIDSGKINFPVAESLIYVDILKGADTIRIFNTHLQSFKFKQADYSDIEKIKDQDVETIDASMNLFNKMGQAFKRRGPQAELVKKALAQTPFPSIICGDFNDVPNSYTYFTIKNNWQDAFLKKGFGIGSSFISLAPTLRIDYILASAGFDIVTFDMIDEGLSDHVMLVSDVQLKK